MTTTASRAPLPAWAAELARLWNGGAHSLFLLHGNVFDLFPLALGERAEYAPLNTFLSRRLFPARGVLCFFDIGEGLTFATPAMQQRFFEWLRIYDEVEGTDFHHQGAPRQFAQLAPVLRRFFLHTADQPIVAERGVTLVISFPEKLVPAAEESGASVDERMALVTLLKWAAAADLQLGDVGVMLITETAAELHADLVQHPHVASIRIPLPDTTARQQFLASGSIDRHARGPKLGDTGNIPLDDLARRTSGLSLLRIEQLVVTALRAGEKISLDLVSTSKRRLIEEYCQGLVRFKDPKPGVSLDHVATHVAAKARLRELAWLIRHQKDDVLERGVLVPGRIGVGKSFLIDCFAGECGLPVVEIGEFRSKWVGETERQQARILLTIRALGPVIVVVDEADAVFGNRSAEGDSGVSTRVFAAFAAHLGDSSLRGRELWIAMTSRPDLLSIDLKRQGRFGLCVPLFAAQDAGEVVELFTVIARVRKIALSPETIEYVRSTLGTRPLTGSDVEAILVRAKERAVLAQRDADVQLADLRDAVDSFIDPLDPDLLALQELAAVLACSDRRFLPARYRDVSRAELNAAYAHARAAAGR
ncbi:MAG: ATP-binding protein [Opitutaceae bacterium]|nr:ATP-binding protein [Opitutaceae bacterium]